MGGGGASGSSGVPSNTSGAAVAYQPTAQPQADLGYQNILGGFAGALGPAFAYAFNNAFPSSNASTFGPYAFAGTPGGVSYDAANLFFGGLGSGTITDPDNPYYLQALQGANTASTGAGTLFGAASPMAYDLFTGGNATPAAFATGSSIANQSANNLAAIGASLGGNALPTLSPAINQGIINAANLNQNLVPYLSFLASDTTQALTSQMTQDLAPLYSGLPSSYASMAPNIQAGANNLVSGANSILNTAFDPQNALYNQLQNQVSQQAQAANAAAGLGGSAYGASTVGNTLSNFDINWQNQQLQRQAQGLSSAAPAYSAATQLPASLANAMTGALSNANQLAYQPLQLGGALGQTAENLNQQASSLPTSLYSQLAQLGGQIGSLGSTAAALPFQPISNLESTGSQLGQIGTQLGSLYGMGGTLSGLPYSTQSADLSNALQALGSWTNLGNQQFTIPQQLSNDLQSYLQLGQAASGLSGQLGALGLNEQQSSLAGIGSALGAGSNLLFGNQGLSGALGLGSSGLLGSLGGGASSLGALSGSTAGNVALDTAAVDTGAIDSGLVGGAGAATGGGFSLGSLLPFGAS